MVRAVWLYIDAKKFAPNDETIVNAIKLAANDLLYGQYHAASMQFPFILLAMLLALAPCAAKRAADDRLSWRQGYKSILGGENCTPALLILVVLVLLNALLSLVTRFGSLARDVALDRSQPH